MSAHPTKHDALLDLAQRVARLNPTAGEIGAGMLADLVARARWALSAPVCRHCEHHKSADHPYPADLCGHPDAKLKRNVVTGRYVSLRCDSARQDLGPCGPAAMHPFTPITLSAMPSIDLRVEFCSASSRVIGFPAELGCLDAIDAMPAGSVRKPRYGGTHPIQSFTFRDTGIPSRLSQETSQ